MDRKKCYRLTHPLSKISGYATACLYITARNMRREKACTQSYLPVQVCRQEMKWGGVFFRKKWTFPQRRVHYVQYQYFLFYILLISGGCVVRTHLTHPPAYRPVVGSTGLTPWRVLKLAHQEAAPTRGRSLMYTIAMLSLRDVGQADNKIAGIARR